MQFVEVGDTIRGVDGRHWLVVSLDRQARALGLWHAGSQTHWEGTPLRKLTIVRMHEQDGADLLESKGFTVESFQRQGKSITIESLRAHT